MIALLSIFVLFFYVMIAFAVYVALNKSFSSLHWFTKTVYGLFVYGGLAADFILGNTVFMVWLGGAPSWQEGTISHRTKANYYNSKLAKFIWDEIMKIDPTHLGGMPKKP